MELARVVVEVERREDPEHERRNFIGVGVADVPERPGQRPTGQQECPCRSLYLPPHVSDAGATVPEHGAVEPDVGVD